MDASLAHQVVEYIQAVQPQLDKIAAQRSSLSNYRCKIARAIDSMVDRGLLSLHEKTAMYRDLAANPERAADLLLHFVEKSAATTRQYSLGGPADKLNRAGTDPILSFILS